MMDNIKIYEVTDETKYVFICEGKDLAEELKETLSAWLQLEECPFIIIDGTNIKLIKVEK